MHCFGFGAGARRLEFAVNSWIWRVEGVYGVLGERFMGPFGGVPLSRIGSL